MSSVLPGLFGFVNSSLVLLVGLSMDSYTFGGEIAPYVGPVLILLGPAVAALFCPRVSGVFYSALGTGLGLTVVAGLANVFADTSSFDWPFFFVGVPIGIGIAFVLALPVWCLRLLGERIITQKRTRIWLGRVVYVKWFATTLLLAWFLWLCGGWVWLLWLFVVAVIGIALGYPLTAMLRARGRSLAQPAALLPIAVILTGFVIVSSAFLLCVWRRLPVVAVAVQYDAWLLMGDDHNECSTHDPRWVFGLLLFKEIFDEIQGLQFGVFPLGVEGQRPPSERAFKVLSTHSNIRALRLYEGSATGQVVSYTRHLPQLEVLELGTGPVTDAGFVHLKTLGKLRFLDLSSTQVTDRGLGYLESITSLETLYVNGRQVTYANTTHLGKLPNLNDVRVFGEEDTVDADLKRLATVPQLRGLYLPNTAISDAGLEYIKDCNTLEVLSLSDTQVTDAGLAHLKGLTNLRDLWIQGTRVTDHGLAHLQALHNLSYLGLEDQEGRITDSAVEQIKCLPNLTSLHLGCIGIGDTGLFHLRETPSIKYVDLDGSSVTHDAIREFRQVRPDVDVYR